MKPTIETATQTITETLTAADARERGYRPLTTAFRAKERWMMEDIMTDLRRSKIDHVLVEVGFGTEIWRTGMK